MGKEVSLSGIVYKNAAGKLVSDYGFAHVFIPSHNAGLGRVEQVSVQDQSECPPLGDSNKQLLPNIVYEGKILSISIPEKKNGSSKKDNEPKMTVIVNDVVGTLLFRRMSDYWGDDSYIQSHYHISMPIKVKLDSNVSAGKVAFTSADYRFIPVKDLRLEVGDVVNARISAIEPFLSIWFNSFPYYINQNDSILENRIFNKVYYPGRPVKARVSDITVTKEGLNRFYFQLVLEQVHYDGLYPGMVCPCIITQNDKSGDLFSASIQFTVEGEEVAYQFRIPHEEIPRDFGGFFNSEVHAKIRIAGFDNLGEPVIQFKSLMEELYQEKEGEVFDITLVRPYSPDSLYRIWTSEDGICGFVLKSALQELGNYQTGLRGTFRGGVFYPSNRFITQNDIRVGDIIQVSFQYDKNYTYALIRKGACAGLLCYPEKAHIRENGLCNVRVVYADTLVNKIVCVPVTTDMQTLPALESESVVQMRILAIGPGVIALGDGERICIVSREEWDWCHGLVLGKDLINKSYYGVRVLETVLPQVYKAERRSLVPNPWPRLASVREGDRLTLSIVRFDGNQVLLVKDGVYFTALWKQISIYPLELGRKLYGCGDEITACVSCINVQERILDLAPTDDPAKLTALVWNADYDASVVKCTQDGLVVSVDGVMGFVPKDQMFHESQYQEGGIIRVKCISRRKNYLEFSHLKAVDLTSIQDLHVGDVIKAKYMGLASDQKWQQYAYGKYVISSQVWTSKYYSADRDTDFSSSMRVNQEYSIRICEMTPSEIFAVPEQMPDYSTVEMGLCFKAVIESILVGYYMVFVPEMNDSFLVLFKDCDWGPIHIEDKKAGDEIRVKVIDYYKRVNCLVLSKKAFESDPWEKMSGVGMVTQVKNLGSPNKNRSLFVELCGVPIPLEMNAILSLCQKPWVGNAYSYNDIKALEDREEFTMVVTSCDREAHTAVLMPYYNNIPPIVHNAHIMRNRTIEKGCWVDCGNGLVGYLPNEELPDGYQLELKLDQAVVKRYDEEHGYAVLSVKDLLVDGGDESGDGQTRDNGGPREDKLRGVFVDEYTELKEGMTVRGTVLRYDCAGRRYYVKLGPYTGSVSFSHITYNLCELPHLALSLGKEYDFVIHSIVTTEKSELRIYLDRRSAAPVPDYSRIKKGEYVTAIVKRFSREKSIIVVDLEGMNIEGVILHDTIVKDFQTPGNMQIRYPGVGTRLGAVIQKVELFSKTEEVSRVILCHTKRI